MNLEIREAIPQDEKAVVEVYRSSLGIDEATAMEDFKGHLSSKTSKVFVALLDGKIIGVVTFYWQTWNMIGRIGVIGVLSEARGKGVGKKLVERCRDFAKKMGIRKIYVDTSVDNVAAQIFYIKCGFYPEHILKDYYADGVDGINFAMYVCSKSP